jgi:hypothetical protein
MMLTGCALLTGCRYLKLEDGSDIIIGPDACGTFLLHLFEFPVASSAPQLIQVIGVCVD